MRRWIWCLVAAIGIAGCQPKADTAAIERRVDELEAKVDKATMKLDQVQKSQIETAVKTYLETHVTLTPSEQSFEAFRTQLGVVTFSVKNVAGYANGSKVTFDFGNLTSATLESVELKLAWGSKSSDGARNELGKKSAKLTESFRPGAWTRFNLVLEQTKPEDLAYIDIVGVDTPMIKLFTGRE